MLSQMNSNPKYKSVFCRYLPLMLSPQLSQSISKQVSEYSSKSCFLVFLAKGKWRIKTLEDVSPAFRQANLSSLFLPLTTLRLNPTSPPIKLQCPSPLILRVPPIHALLLILYRGCLMTSCMALIMNCNNFYFSVKLVFVCLLQGMYTP